MQFHNGARIQILLRPYVGCNTDREKDNKKVKNIKSFFTLSIFTSYMEECRLHGTITSKFTVFVGEFTPDKQKDSILLIAQIQFCADVSGLKFSDKDIKNVHRNRTQYTTILTDVVLFGLIVKMQRLIVNYKENHLHVSVILVEAKQQCAIFTKQYHRASTNAKQYHQLKAWVLSYLVIFLCSTFNVFELGSLKIKF